MKSASLYTGTTMVIEGDMAVIRLYGDPDTYTPGFVDLSVFKAYDIRGRTDTGQITPDLYEMIGHSMVDVLNEPVFGVGRDCRTSSPSLFEGLARGITSAGADVIDLGEVPTDAVYYFSGARSVAGAIITASHNPGNYNGLKLCRPGAAPVGMESGLEEIRDSVSAGSRRDGDPGAITSEEIVDGYIDHLFSIVDAASIGDTRVAVDAGNGMAGVALERVFGRIEASLDGIYLDPDGTFPNHPADPLVPENLADLQKLMTGADHDLGVAFDGDADRAFFLDDLGEPLSGSTITSLIARELLADHPGSNVVHNLIVSKSVPEIVTELGGTPIRTRVGHSFIKGVMAETDAVFGGEHSGHYYFRDNYRADSGMLAMLFLLRTLSRDGRPLSEIRGEVERYVASGEINFEVSDVSTATEAVAVAFSGANVGRLDGLTVDLGDKWFNLRPSNTEPLLRLNAEAADSAALSSLVERVSRIVQDV